MTSAHCMSTVTPGGGTEWTTPSMASSASLISRSACMTDVARPGTARRG